jgi:NAD dependent epimerase/dehydratase family enzyme
MHHAMLEDSIRGPFNLVTPEPVTNRDFTRTLGRVLGRPTITPAPAFALRLALGEMADATLLASTRVRPAILEETGYTFRFPTLEEALRHLLGKAKE